MCLETVEWHIMSYWRILLSSHNVCQFPIVYFALKSFSDINRATAGLLKIICLLGIFFPSFSFNLPVPLYLEYLVNGI